MSRLCLVDVLFRHEFFAWLILWEPSYICKKLLFFCILCSRHIILKHALSTGSKRSVLTLFYPLFWILSDILCLHSIPSGWSCFMSSLVTTSSRVVIKGQLWKSKDVIDGNFNLHLSDCWKLLQRTKRKCLSQKFFSCMFFIAQEKQVVSFQKTVV